MQYVADSFRRSGELAAATRRRARSIAPAFGACGALLLHAFVLGSLAMGWGGRTAAPHPREGLGANAIASSEEAVATLILIEEPGVGPRDEDALEKLASHGVVLQNFRLTIVSPNPTVDAAIDTDDQPDERAPAEDPSSGDRQMQAALFGRYIGQIQARIERAWLRPRTQISGDTFECRVLVLQSSEGDVQEVTLQRCNGDVRWAVSLVQAIERSSPLPAPPKPAVFSHQIQLLFRAEAYVPGGETVGYELEMPQVAAVTDATSQSPGEALLHSMMKAAEPASHQRTTDSFE